jgi:glycine betaine/choline ABC-type transport system substrate-binding protein
MLSYDAMILGSERMARRPDVMQVFSRLANRVKDSDIREANRMVDVEGLPVSTAVAFLQSTID